MLANLPIAPVLRAADVERAKRFYTQTLGLPLMMDMGEVFTVGAGNGTVLAVYQRDGSEAPLNTVAGWQTDDVRAVARDLKARGVTPERYELPGVEYDDLGVATMGGSTMLWFTDSEGNILQVVQM